MSQKTLFTLTSFVKFPSTKYVNVKIRSPRIFTDKTFMIILEVLISLSKETEDLTLNFVLKTNNDVLIELQAYLYKIIKKCLSRDKALSPF
jgi:hypothetical protein